MNLKWNIGVRKRTNHLVLTWDCSGRLVVMSKLKRKNIINISLPEIVNHDSISYIVIFYTVHFMGWFPNVSANFISVNIG